MKGVIFTEFLSMVDDAFCPHMTEQLLGDCDLASGGAYTSVGTYDHQEIINLVGALSARSGVDASDLVKAYGEHLFGRFTKLYPQFFIDAHDLFDFLMEIDERIHGEVRKLYPDADLPALDASMAAPQMLEIVYRSKRGLADAAEGLIIGAAKHFNEPITILRDNLSEGEEQCVRFLVKKRLTAAA
ncbi:MAG: heme NO-binding domain-containing protein [Pseudomonadota bacterium]